MTELPDEIQFRLLSVTGKALLAPREIVGFFAVTWTLVGFLLSRLLRRNDIADLLWGSGITVLVLMMGFLGSSELPGGADWMILMLVTAWGARLTLYLAIRNLPEAEDPRYAAWRKEWGEREPFQALFRVFFLQAILAVCVAAAGWTKFTSHEPALPAQWTDWIFALAAASGLAVEAMADAQLLRFKRGPGNAQAVLRSGLWGWSRHPNYFGEVLFWWGIAGIGIFQVSVLAALGSLGGAALITFLLLKVSGVPMTEAGMARRRSHPEYQQYIDATPAFFPLPPRFRKQKPGNQA